VWGDARADRCCAAVDERGVVAVEVEPDPAVVGLVGVGREHEHVAGIRARIGGADHEEVLGLRQRLAAVDRPHLQTVVAARPVRTDFEQERLGPPAAVAIRVGRHLVVLAVLLEKPKPPAFSVDR